MSLRVLKKDRAQRKAARREAREAVPAADRALFEKLRAKRLELAKAQNVPPYVIFHDKTLTDMAARYPRSVHELAGIPGVGDFKLARFGQAFLDVIKAHDLSPPENVGPDV